MAIGRYPDALILTSAGTAPMVSPGVRVKSESDCFADEIAIDFPSVVHLVARVRASFLADGHDDFAGTLKTEVCLSSDEAFRGTIVPIEVPVRRTCRCCGGRGETWAERCAGCSGYLATSSSGTTSGSPCLLASRTASAFTFVSDLHTSRRFESKRRWSCGHNYERGISGFKDLRFRI